MDLIRQAQGCVVIDVSGEAVVLQGAAESAKAPVGEVHVIGESLASKSESTSSTKARPYCIPRKKGRDSRP